MTNMFGLQDSLMFLCASSATLELQTQENSMTFLSHWSQNMKQEKPTNPNANHIRDKKAESRKV